MPLPGHYPIDDGGGEKRWLPVSCRPAMQSIDARQTHQRTWLGARWRQQGGYATIGPITAHPQEERPVEFDIISQRAGACREPVHPCSPRGVVRLVNDGS